MSANDGLEFKETKKRYTELRAQEKNKIIAALLEYGYPVMNMMFTKELEDPFNKRAGRGLTNYTSNGRIAEYDLSNWMWVNTRKEDLFLSISLQADEIDEQTGNGHVLFDRISFECSWEDGYEYKITDYDLPLNPLALEKMIADLDGFVSSIIKSF